MQNLRITQSSSRPLTELFEALADHNRLSAVFGIPVRRVRDGAASPNGVGSARVLGLFVPLGVEETVTALVPDKSIDYRISRGGFPIRNHQGRIEFAERDGRSLVTWTIRFDSALPLVGTLVRQVLSIAIRRGLRRIA